MISVTVPVYNTSKYLRKSLDSLKAQTLKDIEFILVDDGSTDECGSICDEYAVQDQRFRVIHQKNGGLAAARQTGLENAQGEYLIVCDSDDWVEPDMYEKLYSKAKETNADIVLCGYYAEYDNGKSMPVQTVFNERNGYVDNDDLIRRGAGSSWVKLVRKSLFEKTKSSYEYGINLSEDALIVYKLMRGNPKVVQINESLYHYRRLYGGQSYTNNIKMDHILQLRFTYNWLKDHYIEAKYQPLIHQKALDIAFACLRVNNLDREYIDSFMKNELPWKSLLATKVTAKSIVSMALKTIPLPLVRFCVRSLYRFVYK